jgi:hypothetical protein
MARVGRLAGAILAETEGRYFLVGNTKAPCDFAKAGFEPVAEIDAQKSPYVALSARGAVSLAAPYLEVDVEGEALARLLAERFLIERNGSVSDRLWRLVVDPETSDKATALDARWLAGVPRAIWQIVRNEVLRCS